MRSSVYDFETRHLGYNQITGVVYFKPGPDGDDSIALGDLHDDRAFRPEFLAELATLRAQVREAMLYALECRATADAAFYSRMDPWRW